MVYVTKDVRIGSQTQIFLCTSKTISFQDDGKFYDNSKESTLSEEVNDGDAVSWLWKETEMLTGLHYP